MHSGSGVKMNKEILPPDEAQRIGLRFIHGKYYHGKITIDKPELVTKGAFPVYHLTGNIKIPSRSAISKLFSPAAEYTFKMQIHAIDGSILNYELR
ncbi:hypothetical protein ES703_87090 [subsurface metagenome]